MAPAAAVTAESLAGAGDPGCATMGASGGSGCVTTGGAGGVAAAGGPVERRRGCERPLRLRGDAGHRTMATARHTPTATPPQRSPRTRERRSEAERTASGEDGRVTEQEPFRALARTLYVVATPLGNLRDVTLRALDVLRSGGRHRRRGHARHAPCCFAITASRRARCRCTRTTRRGAPSAIVDALREGRSVALVSDAGTPAVSDPGARLVRAVRDAGLRRGADPRRQRGDRRGLGGRARRRTIRLSRLPAVVRQGAARVALAASRPCRSRSSSTRRRIACAHGCRARRCARRRTCARRRARDHEEIRDDHPDAARRGASWFAAEANPRARRVRADRRRAGGGDRRGGGADAPNGIACFALDAELPPARAARVAAAATGLSREACMRGRAR